MQASQHPWFEPPMLVGVKAGGFVLENVLGAGGFGAVYLTRSDQDEPLAVKVLFPPRSRESADIADYTSRLSHFQREIQFAASFHHPNIMRIRFSGSLLWHYDDSSESQPGSYRAGDYNLPYYVTDYLPDSVEQRLRGGIFTYTKAVEIGKQVCEALEALHGADPSILHLDLNPSNVRLAEGGRVVITDFGLVRVEGMPQGDVTRETTLIPPYVAAPEQRAEEDLDIRTDIYQVGALLFLMVTGKGRREFAVMTLLDQPNVPQSLARVIERCTRHDKELRFQDATRVKEALVAAKASRFEKFVQMPIRSLADHLSRVDKKLGTHVPPLWRKPAFWLLGFPVALIGVILFVVLPTDPDPIEITMASSSTKKEWVNQAVKAFNEDSETNRQLQVDGRPIHVEVLLEEGEPGVFDHYRSGSMVSDIFDHKIEPTIASPAEQSWIRKLRAEWRGSKAEKALSLKLGQDLSDAVIITGEAPGLLRTPLVIAMWQSRAEALGCWPMSGPDCTWARLRNLTASPDGWGMLGHSEWGKLKFGYGYVGRSNSATFTQALSCMSGLQIISGLTLEEVSAENGCGEAMHALTVSETALIRIHQRSDRVLRDMRDRGSEYLDAGTNYEKKVIEVMQESRPLLPEPIVAVYPQDGTIAPTHPIAILDGAPWVTSVQEDAAAVFLQFLLSDQQQSRLVSHGLRPTDPTKPLGPPIDRLHGVDPEANLVLVEVPGTQAIGAIVELWTRMRLGDCPR